MIEAEVKKTKKRSMKEDALKAIFILGIFVILVSGIFGAFFSKKNRKIIVKKS